MEKLTRTKKVHTFYISGHISDEAQMPTVRKTWEAALDSQMRDFGYIPMLDIDPQMFTSYEPDHERFVLTVTIYGVYVGKRKSWDLLGLQGTTLIPASSPSDKQKASSEE
jgi:hypothetical protein